MQRASALILLFAAAQTCAGGAPEILNSAGIQGGLVVHVGCGDGRLTAALHAGDSLLVHGLDADAANIQAARKHIQSLGLYGPVSVRQWAGQRLPYKDNLAKLIVVNPGSSVDRAELLRVLCPGGIAVFATDDEQPAPDTLVKPWPPEIDEWTHFLHGPDGHVMSRDQVVGPPWHVQWVGAPEHARSHAHLTTMNVMVTAGGRLFYIADQAATALPDELPSRWALFARDAFSGVELWHRPLRLWQPYYVKDRNSYPADLHRRLVAAGNTVFATLEILGPVSAVDAASGKTQRVYAGTEQTEDIVYEAGILYLSINLGDPQQIDRLQMAYRHVEPTQKRILAIEADTGRVLWDKADDQTDGLMPMTLAVKNDRLFFQNPQGVVCLAKATGRVLWSSDRPSDYLRPGWSSPTLVALDDVVISADRQSGPGQRLGKDQYAAGGFSTGDLVAFSAATGERLWSASCAEGCRAPTDVFNRGRELWFGKALERNPLEYIQAHDLLTGEVLREFSSDRPWPSQHHHRCYRDKATVNYILGGRTGVEFIELDTGQVTLHNWLRGSCKFGILPANGLLYLPPEQCGCYIESKLTGFHALAPREAPADDGIGREENRLQPGPAYASVDPSPSDAPASDDWPTFRADNARSGRVAARVPADGLAERWRIAIGGGLTQPVVAGDVLLVAAADAHSVHALDSATGKRLWQFVADSRIDSPPTVAQGLAVLGCRDGWVYALRLSDGQLAWRWRAAPGDRLVVDNGHLESAWPVHGSVLIRENSVYVAAGRSSYLDGGVHMARLDLHTGRPEQTRVFHSRDPQTGETVPLYEPFPATSRLARMEMPGVLPDVLSSQGDRIWMRAVTFDTDLEIAAEFPPHLFCSMGFLDDSWWELTYWMYGQHMFSGRSGITQAIGLYPTARIMVCDQQRVYGWQEGYEGIRSPAFAAWPKTPRREPAASQGKRAARLAQDWSRDLPTHVFGLVLAEDTLFVAGPPRIDAAAARELLGTLGADAYDPPPLLREAMDTFAGQRGGVLCALRASDGHDICQLALADVPVFDGLIAARGCLYLSTRAGSVVCLGTP
jgi:outer membrane protein assembly factor BamB